MRKNSITNSISPLIFLTSEPMQDYNNIKLSVGDYVEVCEDNHYQTTSIYTRGILAITLNAVNNSTGNYYFISLAIGQRLTRGQ